jgi:hypothetical protein
LAEDIAAINEDQITHLHIGYVKSPEDDKPVSKQHRQKAHRSNENNRLAPFDS